MSARIVKRDGNKITLELEMELDGNMLDQEQAIQIALNEAGRVATQSVIEGFDTTQGKPIVVKDRRLTSKGLKKKG